MKLDSILEYNVANYAWGMHISGGSATMYNKDARKPESKAPNDATSWINKFLRTLGDDGHIYKELTYSEKETVKSFIERGILQNKNGIVYKTASGNEYVARFKDSDREAGPARGLQNDTGSMSPSMV